MTRFFLLFFFSFSWVLWSQTTKITVFYQTEKQDFLSIRGNQSGFTWKKGKKLNLIEGNTWEIEIQDNFEELEFKILWRDMLWSKGANYRIRYGEHVRLYPFFGNQRGILAKEYKFWSPELKNFRTLRIYLPPSYFENRLKRYPVLYVQDGQNLFEGSSAAFGVEWSLDESLDKSILKGKMDEIIVVGIDNMGSRRLFEYTTKSKSYKGSGGEEVYSRFLRQTVIPYVNEKYRTLKGPENTAIMGSSLGGLISFQLAWKHPEIFGKIASLSGSFWWNKNQVIREIAESGGPKKEIKLYLDAGVFRDGLEENKKLNKILRTKGYKLLFYEDKTGRHREEYWAKRVWRPLNYLFPFQSTKYSSS